MGFCMKCGNELPDDAMFCGKCGMTVETQSMGQPEQPKQAEKKKNRKLPIIIAIIVVVLVAAGLIIFGKDIIQSDGFKKVVNLFNPQNEKVNNYTYYFSGTDLYLVDLVNEKSSKIGNADSVRELGGNWWLPQFSTGGEQLLYVKDSNLYYQNVMQAEYEDSIQVNDIEKLAWAQISKDGKKIVYARYEDESDCSFFLYDVEEGTEELIHTFPQTNIEFCKATDESDIIVFYNDKGELFKIKNGKKVEQIDTDVNDLVELYETGEIYYVTYDGEKSWLMYSDGAEGKVVGEFWPRTDMIYKATSWGTWAEDEAIMAFFNEGEWSLAVKDEVFTFTNVSFSVMDTLMNYSYGMAFSKAGDEVYYLDDDVLYHADVTKKGLENIEEYDNGISKCFLYVLNDGGIVYIKNDSLYINGKCVHDGLIRVELGILEDETTGDIFYQDADSDLICYDGKVENIVASNVTEAMISDNGAVLYWQTVVEKEYHTDDVCSVFGFMNGETTLLNENVGYPHYLFEAVRGSKKRGY